ncbi:hypothetical protein L596_027816 [Steinernema carpocapsae]|uniref:Uncharacterized protein n=1 Tax=Steinernema carpocapsae TaxID=34508 RepID=A0A4U5LWM3_STECR|nr:hypothetical protein L596_027816 [Steinernema carpocapsae]
MYYWIISQCHVQPVKNPRVTDSNPASAKLFCVKLFTQDQYVDDDKTTSKISESSNSDCANTVDPER